MYVNLSMCVQLFEREREREREREGCVGVLKREKGICHEREKA